MSIYFSGNLRLGHKIIFNKEPYEIFFSEFVKPGKGQAFVRVKLKNLLNLKTISKTFKTSDYFFQADILSIKVIYLYNDGSFWYFMNKNTFEHICLLKEKLYGREKWLFNQSNCIVTLWNNNPVTISVNNFVELEVIEVDPVVKGNTINSLYKKAKLSTGVSVQVPLFIQKNDVVKLDTRLGKYVSRINK